MAKYAEKEAKREDNSRKKREGEGRFRVLSKGVLWIDQAYLQHIILRVTDQTCHTRTGPKRKWSTE